MKKGIGLLCFWLLLMIVCPVLAQEISSDSWIEPEGSYILSVGSHEKDVFFLKTDSDAAYYRVDFKNEEVSTTVYMTLYDGNGLKLDEASASKGHSAYLSWKEVPGEQYIIIFTRYNSKETGRISFSAAKTPDLYPNEREQALALPLDETVLTSFDGTGDTDWFTFTAAEGSAYYRADMKNETVGSTAYLTLYDKNGLKLYDTNASKGHACYLSWKAVPGDVYYLGMTRYDKYQTGRYTVTLTRTPDSDGNALEEATVIAADQPLTASFDGTGDTDWFTFTAAEGSAYYRADMKNETVGSTAYLTLYDKNGLKLYDTNASKGHACYLSWKAVPGDVYYLGMTRYDKYQTGRYTVTLTRTPDSDGNALEEATVIAVDQPLTASFDGTGDTDWFTFTAAEDSAYYRADMKNETVGSTAYLTLYDKDGLKLYDADASKGHACYLSWKAGKGETYYLALTRYDKYQTGRYTLALSSTVDSEGNTMEEAAQLTIGQSAEASFDGSGDVDMFKVTASQNNAHYQVDFKNEDVGTTVYMELLDASGLKIVSSDASKGRSAWINWKAEPGAVYYLHCYRYDKHQSGRYTFTVREFVDAEPDEASAALPLPAGETVYPLGSSKDTDWFLLSHDGAPVYTQLALRSDGGCGRLSAVLYDAAGKELSSWKADEGKENAKLFALEADNARWLCVNGQQAGFYTLIRTDIPDVGGSSTATAFRPEPLQENGMAFETDDDVDYAAFPNAGAVIAVTGVTDTAVYVTSCDASGQPLSDEMRVRAGETCTFAAVRDDMWLRLRGDEGSFRLLCCTPDKHAESGTWLTVREATCSQEGEQHMLCTICRLPAQVQPIPMKAHTPMGDWQVKQMASCVTEGREEKHCLACGELLEQRVLPATGHPNAAWEVLLAPTCASDGLQLRACPDCGQQLGRETLPAYGHVADAMALTQKPSCVEEGLKEQRCRVCGEVLAQETIAALGHTPGELVLKEPAACETDGLKQQICLVCGEVLAEEILPKTGHLYGDWIEVKAPTRSEEGVEEQACAHCGDVQQRPVEKLTFLQSIFGR